MGSSLNPSFVILWNLDKFIDAGEMKRCDLPELEWRMLERMRWTIHDEKTKRERAAKATQELNRAWGGNKR
jgi:hypothetical protein